LGSLVTQLEVTSHKTDMPQNAIPVDVLLNILEYVGQKDLATMCRVNKICCSCSQDVLYRDIFVRGSRVQHTLAQLTHLAKKVRSFGTRVYSDCLPMALRNMTSLRILKLPTTYETDVLDGCTFKLDSFECTYLAPYEESFKKFLSSQPSLKCVTLPIPTTSFSLEGKRSAEDIMNDWTCLPNLTRIDATFFWLPYLIPGRPLNEVIIAGSTPNKRSIDWSFFALSTTPIQKLTIDYSFLYSTPIHLLASFLPSLTHFTLIILDRYTFFKDEEVCELPLY
jgi:hypothetical protein